MATRNSNIDAEAMFLEIEFWFAIQSEERYLVKTNQNYPEIIFVIDFCILVQFDVSKHLHSNDCINEKQHQHQQANIW